MKKADKGVVERVAEVVGEGFSVEKFVESFDVLAEAAGGVAALKRLVLDLCVMGRIGDRRQLTCDVAGERSRLKTIKTELACAAGGRRQAEFIPEGALAPPQELPSGWFWARLDELAWRVEYGTSERPTDNADQVPILRMNNISGGRLTYEHLKYVPRTGVDIGRLLLEPGDILFNRTNSYELVGKAAVYLGLPGTHTFASYLIRVSVVDGIHRARFVGYYLSSSVCRSTQIEPGVVQQNGQANFNGTKLRSIWVPVPPDEVLEAVVHQVDVLLHLCDELEARQSKEREIGARLTKSAVEVLMRPAATPEQRFAVEQLLNGHTPTPDARAGVSALGGAIISLALAGVLCETNPRDDALVEVKGRKPDQPWTRREGPYELPPSWAWVHLEQIVGSVTDGDHQPPPKSEAGVPFLTIGNISSGHLDFGATRFVGADYFASLDPRRVPRRGDILYTVVGASYGRPVRVSVATPFCVQRHVAILRPDGTCDSDYLYLVLRSPLAYRQATAAITGTAQPTVPLRPLRRFLVPLPPLAEQRRIVAKVEHLLSLCDALEASLRRAEDRASRYAEAVVRELVA